MKYNIRKCTINFSLKIAKNANKKFADLKTKFEKYNENYLDNVDYKICKQHLDPVHKEKAKDIKIRSKCESYELGENSANYF